MDSFRLRVLKAITTAIEEIDGTSTWQNDFRNSVFRGRAVFGETDPLPMISILEAPLPQEQGEQRGGLVHGPWELVIQGFAVDDKKNPTDPAHSLLADVKKRIAAEAVKVNDGKAFGFKEIEGITIGPGVVRPPDKDIGPNAYFWLSVVFKIAEDLLDPYA